MEQELKKKILSRFSEYYKSSELDVPSVEKREIGVGFDKKIDARHYSFETLEAFRNHLVYNTPFFVSYSAAYYEIPSATPIEKKGWQGADLIFDLDAEMKTGLKIYKELENVKQDAIRLVEEFIVPDFGLSKKNIVYVFSGNRGYHIHIRDKEVFGLGAQERREIVDYIRGVGLDYRKFFYEGERAGQIYGPKSDSWGYKGRFVRKMLKTLGENPSSIYRGFKKEDVKKNFLKGIDDGNWSRSPVKDIVQRMGKIASEIPLYSVNADAAVTYDVKKLIRVPNSIHGSTGLIAKKIDRIEKFDPLKDALAFEKEKVNIEGIHEVQDFEFGGESVELKKGEKKEVGESLGLFLTLKGAANLVF